MSVDPISAMVKQSPNLRNSFSSAKLKMAKDLDSSINYELTNQAYPNGPHTAANPSPRHGHASMPK